MSITKTKDLIRIFNKNNEKIKTINRDLTLVRYRVSDIFPDLRRDYGLDYSLRRDRISNYFIKVFVKR